LPGPFEDAAIMCVFAGIFNSSKGEAAEINDGERRVVGPMRRRDREDLRDYRSNEPFE
jgi:hypothetical protein